jgi:hypothetical protein
MKLLILSHFFALLTILNPVDKVVASESDYEEECFLPALFSRMMTSDRTSKSVESQPRFVTDVYYF